MNTILLQVIDAHSDAQANWQQSGLLRVTIHIAALEVVYILYLVMVIWLVCK